MIGADGGGTKMLQEIINLILDTYLTTDIVNAAHILTVNCVNDGQTHKH